MSFYSLKRISILTLIPFFSISLLLAQNNDDFANALELASNYCSDSDEFSNVGYSGDGVTPSGWYQQGPDANAWFKFQATTNSIDISIENGTGLIRRLSIHNSEMTEVVSKLGLHFNPFISYTDLIIGEWYYVNLDSYQSMTGSFGICLNSFQYNDNPDDAIVITLEDNFCSVTNEFNNTYATGDGTKPNYWQEGPNYNVWFKFQAISPSIDIDIITGSASDDLEYGMVALFDSEGDELGSVGYNGSSSNRELIVYNQLIYGNWYFVSIDSKSGSTQGNFSMCIESLGKYNTSETAFEINDINNYCSESAQFSNEGASSDPTITPQNWQSLGGGNIWFEFIADATSVDIFLEGYNTEGTLRYGMLALYDEFNTEIASKGHDGIGVGNLLEINGKLTPGDKYFLTIDNYEPSDPSYDGSFMLCTQSYGGVDHGNDSFESSLDISYLLNDCSSEGEFWNNHGGQSFELTLPRIPGEVSRPSDWEDYGGRTVWFKFQALEPGIEIDLEPFNYVNSYGVLYRDIDYGMIALYDDAMNELASKGHNSSNGSSPQVQYENLTVGDWYYVAVDNKKGDDENAGAFDLCLNNYPVPFYPGSTILTSKENRIKVKGFGYSYGNVSYSITGGSDQNAFSIDSESGSLSFISPSDYENPIDSDLNNVYELDVTVTNGANSNVLSLTITVVDEPEFISVWDTENIHFYYDSPIDKIKLPMVSSGEYNYYVNWGDGQVDHVDNFMEGEHSYDIPGIYTVTISGIYDGWSYGGGNQYASNRERRRYSAKLISIESWGNLNLGNYGEYFRDCYYLEINATDVPNLNSTYNFDYFFANCLKLQDIPNLPNWNTNHVTSMRHMFDGAKKYDQDIGDLDISNVSDMSGMLDNTGLSELNYENLLVGWNSGSKQNDVELGVFNLKICNAYNTRKNLTDVYGWNIKGDIYTCDVTIPFISTWRTRNSKIELPIYGKNFNISYSKTDGTVTGDLNNLSTSVHGSTADRYDVRTNYVVIELPEDGFYDLAITGGFYGFNDWRQLSSRDWRFDILSIEQWGNNKWWTLKEAFQACYNLRLNANDVPDLEFVNDMSYMFQRVKSINESINDWNTSNVENLEGMFMQSRFNFNIEDWNVGKVKNMNLLFWGSKFNNSLADWDVSNVESMYQMFYSNSDFNQDISMWNTDNVQDMSWLFAGASKFDQDISSWNIERVADMSLMLSRTNMSRANYDALLNSWGNQNVKENVELGANGRTYCSGNAARQILIGKGWEIYGDEFDCSSPSARTVDEVSEVLEFSQIEENSFIIYPNPSDISFIISGEDLFGSTVSIYDLLGKKMMEINSQISSAEVNTTSLHDGMYMVRIHLPDGTKLEKRIIIKH